MDLEILIPVTLFLCITYAIKFVVEARFRKPADQRQRFGRTDPLAGGRRGQRRRHASLRWGVALARSLAFALIEAFGWREVTPGVIAVLLSRPAWATSPTTS